MGTNEQDITLEDALDEIREIVEALEGGDETLDVAMDRFRRGSELISLCRHRLSEAELRIREVGDQESADR